MPWLASEGASPSCSSWKRKSTALLITLSAIVLAFIVAYFVALIGLLLLKHWARTLYVAVFIAGVALYPFMGAAISTPVASTVDYPLSACSGAIVALLWMNSVREHFTHAEQATMSILVHNRCSSPGSAVDPHRVQRARRPRAAAPERHR